MRETPWSEHASAVLGSSGHRWGAARLAVVEVLSSHSCCLTARDIADELRASGQTTGIASVYRALDLLHDLGLVQRLDVGDGTARYEPADPSGEHHHHLVCDRCGRVTAFEDERLELAIAALAGRVDHAIDAHDVVLRGACPSCRTGPATPHTHAQA
jgi:Fur family transcriptional regulator, ferric uptake regulator